MFDPAEDAEEGTAETSSETEEVAVTGTTEEKAKATPSAIEIVEIRDENDNLTALYLVRAEDIDDIDSEADGNEDGLNTVKRSVKSLVLEEKAVADLEAQVEAGGSKYTLKSVKRKALDKIMKEVMG